MKRTGLSGDGAGADVEVVAKAQRRSYTAEYKQRILEEADQATTPGAIGALLRREGLYSSALTNWRRERKHAVEQAFSAKRGPRPRRVSGHAETEKLRRENERLRHELYKAHTIIEVQKKVASLLGIPLATVPDNEKSS
jgi:transposase